MWVYANRAYGEVFLSYEATTDVEFGTITATIEFSGPNWTSYIGKKLRYSLEIIE